MTAVTFVLLALLSCIMSSSTWLSLDWCAELGKNEPSEEISPLSGSCKHAIIHDSHKTKPTLICKSVSSNGPLDLLQRAKGTVNAEEENTSLNCLVYLFCKTNFLEPKSDKNSMKWNYRNADPSFVLGSVTYGVHISTLVLVHQWKILEHMSICKKSNVEILQGFPCRELGPEFPDCDIMMLADGAMNSEASKRVPLRTCSVKVTSKFCSTLKRSKAAYITQTEGIKITTVTREVAIAQPPDSSRCVGGFFLTAVLLLAIYTTKVNISNRVMRAHKNNSTVVMRFTVTICLPLSFTPRQVSHVMVLCFFYALGRTVHVLIACRAGRTVVKMFFPAQEKPRARLFTFLLLWLTFSVVLQNKSWKQWSGICVDSSVGSTLIPWNVTVQMEPLPSFYHLFVCVLSFLWFIPNKVDFLSLLCHLVTCQLNSWAPTMYVLVIEIKRI